MNLCPVNVEARGKSANSQQGVALAILLWMIAALSLMVAGIVLMARIDVRLAQIQVREVQAAAIGDGVAHLMMRDMMSLQNAGSYAQRGLLLQSYELGGRPVQARAVPVSGLIDINQASAALWVDLLQHVAGLDEVFAVDLAENIVAWRMPITLNDEEPAQRRGRFEVPEDLLLVADLTREIFDRIRPAIHAYQGSAGVDLASAPAEVLIALARGDRELVESFMAERAADPMASWDGYPGLAAEYVSVSSSVMFRVDARIQMTDGKILQRSRWVRAGSPGRDQLPWRMLRSEPVIAVDHLNF